MGFLAPKAPKVPAIAPPPVPAPPPPPPTLAATAATNTSSAAAMEAARVRGAVGSGFAGTILTSPQGTAAPQTGKTLLGA